MGGVVGLALLALIAWLLMRRRHRQNDTTANPYSAVYRGEELSGQNMAVVHQLEDSQMVYEAGAGKTSYAHHQELPVDPMPVELPAEQRRLA